MPSFYYLSRVLIMRFPDFNSWSHFRTYLGVLNWDKCEENDGGMTAPCGNDAVMQREKSHNFLTEYATERDWKLPWLLHSKF